MKKLNSPNSNHLVFFLAIIADVFLLYNLIQYIRYGLDTYFNGFIASLGIGMITTDLSLEKQLLHSRQRQIIIKKLILLLITIVLIIIMGKMTKIFSKHSKFTMKLEKRLGLIN